jgi:hypothetical protein
MKKLPKLNLNSRARIEEDNCYHTVRDMQNISCADYMVKSFNDCECPAKNIRDIAMNEPTITFRDGYGWSSVDGCNIDADSKVRNAPNLTNLKYIQQLYTRPYATVPFMGRGVTDPVLENIMITGEDTSQKKQCNTLSGIYIDRFDPLVPCLKDNVQNPIHLVTEVVRPDWIWGGLPSRDLIRNTSYLQKCGYRNNGKGWLKPDSQKK